MSLLSRIKFFLTADRIGSDMVLTHWLLYWPFFMRLFCQSRLGAFGVNSEVRPGSYIIGASKVFIGNNVVIRPGSFIYSDSRPGGGEVHIEDKVLLGPCVHVYANDHSYGIPHSAVFDQGYPPPSRDTTVYLRKGCWIGASSIILRGVEIGCNSVVAAGAVVTKSIPPNVLVAGVPARIVRVFNTAT